MEIEEDATAELEKPKRARGHILMQLLCQEASQFIQQCNYACGELGTDRVKTIKTGLKITTDKVSTEQLENDIKQLNDKN